MESEQSVKSLFETAFKIIAPQVNSLQANDDLWPIKMGISKLEPFMVSYAQAVISLLEINTQVKATIKASSENHFEVHYEDCELFDKGTFLLIACEAAEQVISCSKINGNCLDASLLIKEFNPKNLNLDAGDSLDVKKLKQGLIASILNETGILDIRSARKTSHNLVEDSEVVKVPTAGPTL